MVFLRLLLQPSNDIIVGVGIITKTMNDEEQETQEQQQAPVVQVLLRPCCQFMREGKCTMPRPPCRLHHVPDDGVSPCFYGAACRNGHKNRVLGGMTVEERVEFWRDFNAKRGSLTSAYEHPGERDVTQLRCQLEPWSTAHLRLRLAHVFGEDHVAMDALPRGQVMQRLLQQYHERSQTQQQRRKTIRVLGTPVDPTMCAKLLVQLRAWSEIHKVNSRPSIHASNYMILRSPSEFGQQAQAAPPEYHNGNTTTPPPSPPQTTTTTPTKLSKKARMAAKKIQQFQPLWDLAKDALQTIDPTFSAKFSALAVTKNFRGSPHIDKQNTGPFYGLALGNFDDGTGGVCVEVDAFTVAHVNTKGRLAKVDGRYPHWVAPYTFDNLDKNNNAEEERYRYSLIFYSTTYSYGQPGPAYFGEAMEEDNDTYVVNHGV